MRRLPRHAGPRQRLGVGGKALHLAKVTAATLVIAKLDRLSRNAAFLLTLRDSGVRFAAVDLPEANDLTVGIMALVAQAGARGDLEADEGGAGGGQEPRRAARQPERRGGAPAGWQGRCAAPGGHRAERRTACAGPCSGRRGHPAGGATSLRAIAAELNARGMLTRRGGRWHVSTVTNLLDRLGLGGTMRQSRLMSLVEAMANVVVGFVVAVLLRCWCFRDLGSKRHSVRTWQVGAIFTGVSIAAATRCGGVACWRIVNDHVTRAGPSSKAQAARCRRPRDAPSRYLTTRHTLLSSMSFISSPNDMRLRSRSFIDLPCDDRI